MAYPITITAIKADVGSIGGHTRPSEEMMKRVQEKLREAKEKTNLLKDFLTWFTGDDICLLMTHPYSINHEAIHSLAWNIFNEAGDIAQLQGLYGAKQDLLVDAPSGNLRGAGPGVAEITFAPDAPERKGVEPFLVFTGDKCSPGAFNLPLWAVYTSPMYCAGLMLPNMIEGFTFVVVDMEHAGGDRVIKLDAPEDHIRLALLLRDENRFGVREIYSRTYPAQQVVAVSTDRLHTIAGEYKGKDDPVAIVRTQGIFPAPEEVISPYMITPYVAGGARGSHQMPWMPMPVNSPLLGPYCIPIVSCLAFSVTQDGQLQEPVDVFADRSWDWARQQAQEKAKAIRSQGFFGAAMLPWSELEYGGYREVLAELEERFVVN